MGNLICQKKTIIHPQNTDLMYIICDKNGIIIDANKNVIKHLYYNIDDIKYIKYIIKYITF